MKIYKVHVFLIKVTPFDFPHDAPKMETMKSRRPAYSLIFAFLIMTVIMIIASTTVENTTEKLAYFREMEGSTEALLAAQSAAEQAVLAIKDFNPGYSLDLTENVFRVDENDDGVYETWGDYTVYSSAMENTTDSSGTFYTPIPGTGTAGSSDDCSIQNDHQEVDHPCNWNKLLYGQSASIPLYTDDGSGGILTAADFSSYTGWYLKVRTPCADTEGQPDEYECSTRFEFDGDGSDNESDTTDDDSSVIFWQLVEDVLGNPVSLLPDDENYQFGSNILRRSENTEIYEDRINDAYTSGDYIVLEGTNSSPYTELYQVCTETHTDYPNDLSTLSLQLDIVTPLIDLNDDPIPYLEWQLALSASEPFGDTKAIVVGEGYHQGEKGIFYFPFVISRSTTGESASVYTLSN